MPESLVLALILKYMPIAIIWAQAFLWFLRIVQALLWPLRFLAVHGLVAGAASMPL